MPAIFAGIVFYPFFLGADFFAAAFLGDDFLAADFFAVDFLGADFFLDASGAGLRAFFLDFTEVWSCPFFVVVLTAI